MRNYLFLLAAYIFAGCSSGAGMVTERQVQNDANEALEPFDTLAAYRKRPGEPKTVDVRGYYRKDSTYVAGFKRSAKKKRG